MHEKLTHKIIPWTLHLLHLIKYDSIICNNVMCKTFRPNETIADIWGNSFIFEKKKEKKKNSTHTSTKRGIPSNPHQTYILKTHQNSHLNYLSQNQHCTQNDLTYKCSSMTK